MICKILGGPEALLAPPVPASLLIIKFIQECVLCCKCGIIPEWEKRIGDPFILNQQTGGDKWGFEYFCFWQIVPSGQCYKFLVVAVVFFIFSCQCLWYEGCITLTRDRNRHRLWWLDKFLDKVYVLNYFWPKSSD